MSLFDKITGKLFPSHKRVDVHEVLKRPPRFLEEYECWSQGDQYGRLLRDLSKSWSYQLNNMKSPVDMVIYTSDRANGFTVYPAYGEGLIPLAYLMEFIKNRVLEAPYRLVHADRRINEKKNFVQTIEKYYLKPEPSFESPIDQQYGNINLELFKHDQEETRLKLLVTIYSDRLYNQAKPFGELVSFLFDI